MTEAMGQAIAETSAALASDDGLRAVVLTGAGRAFSAGGDLDMIAGMNEAGRADPGGATRERNREFMGRFYRLYLSVREIPVPTPRGDQRPRGGRWLLCLAGLRPPHRRARGKLGFNFNRLGIHPGMAATWNLPRLVGPAHAADLLYTGRLVDGAEAERLGLVNRAPCPATRCWTMPSPRRRSLRRPPRARSGAPNAR